MPERATLGSEDNCHPVNLKKKKIFCHPNKILSDKMSVYDDLILHISPDKFYVESLSARNVVLVIDRINYNISLETNNDQIPAIASR